MTPRERAEEVANKLGFAADGREAIDIIERALDEERRTISDIPKVDSHVEGMRAAMVEMRRTAVNFFDASGWRCEGDECNHFATWRRTARDYPMNSCDHCIEDMRAMDHRTESKGGHVNGEWRERSDAAAVRELASASASVGAYVESSPATKEGDE